MPNTQTSPHNKYAHLTSALSSMMKLAQGDTIHQAACNFYFKGTANCGMGQEWETMTWSHVQHGSFLNKYKASISWMTNRPEKNN